MLKILIVDFDGIEWPCLCGTAVMKLFTHSLYGLRPSLLA